MSARLVLLLALLGLAPQASALTNSAVEIQWTPTADPTIRYELRWQSFANGWAWMSIASNLDSTLGIYRQTFTPLPDTSGDRGACWDARAVRGALASAWLSETQQQVCLQLPLSAASAPIPVPVPTPEPPPVPAPSGLHIVSATGEQVVIEASVADCPRLVTSTKGSTSTVLKRTVTCVK